MVPRIGKGGVADRSDRRGTRRARTDGPWLALLKDDDNALLKPDFRRFKGKPRGQG